MTCLLCRVHRTQDHCVDPARLCPAHAATFDRCYCAACYPRATTLPHRPIVVPCGRRECRCCAFNTPLVVLR